MTKIKWKDIKVCFSNKREYKYNYLGYHYNLFVEEAGEPYEAIERVVRLLDSKAKPKWCPRFILNLLHLFGNGNSVYRVRNFFLHNLLNKLTKGNRLYDIKEKFGMLRIYGDFDEEVDAAIREAEEIVDAYFAEFYTER